MRLRSVLLSSLAFTALAACGARQDGAGGPAPDEDLCKAADYQSLIGANAAALSLPADLPHRIYKEGDAVTMDHRPDRLNIVTDADGVVIEVKCG